MMSCTIALSVDYSLFMLSRFREERFQGKDIITSVEKMMQYAAHNVTVSGFTIFIAFLGLIFAPIELLASLGAGCSVAILLTMIINIIMTPTLILCFGNYFATFW